MTPDLSPPPHRLLALVEAYLPARPEADRLVRRFWRHRRVYRGRFARSLLAVARGRFGDAWEVRCLAALMLQHQCVCLPVARIAESARLLRDLGLKASPDPDGPLDDLVLEEGYSTTRLPLFLDEFRRKLARREGLHRDLRQAQPALRAWREFFQLAGEPCAIDLARYVFTPREVVDRVLGSLRLTEGDPAPPLSTLVPSEADALRARWPRYEREIARFLTEGRAIYWAGEATETGLNALAAQPPGTVVVVVKPPGSTLEIELKRTGRRDRLPLGVVAEREGVAVPRSHRLDGGSMISSLRFEAAASARFALIFRAVWGRHAPVPIVLTHRFVTHVPVGDRAVDLLDYYTKAEVFGARFPAMRAALASAVAAFDRESASGLPELPGALGLTVRFLHATGPGQAILAGTSLFRLDVLARLLEAAVVGADHRRAERLLEQILGPVRSAGRVFRGDLDAAFAVPENRLRADRVFRSLMRQLGTFWGTLLAARGYSNGESFVARNVGISPAWERGRWRVRLIFMDHDDLHLPIVDDRHFRPDQVLPGTLKDASFALGRPGPPRPPACLVDYLRVIYRVQPATLAEGDAALRRALTRSYRRTTGALRTAAPLRDLYSPTFLDGSDTWDRMIATRLNRLPDDSDWSEQARAHGRRGGMNDHWVALSMDSIEQFAPFLERMAMLSGRLLSQEAPGC